MSHNDYLSLVYRFAKDLCVPDHSHLSMVVMNSTLEGNGGSDTLNELPKVTNLGISGRNSRWQDESWDDMVSSLLVPSTMTSPFTGYPGTG